VIDAKLAQVGDHEVAHLHPPFDHLTAPITIIVGGAERIESGCPKRAENR